MLVRSVLIIVLVAFFAIGLLMVLAEPTGRQMTLAEQDQAAAEQSVRELCAMRRTCIDYAEALQTCATAANVDRCVNIKLHNVFHGMCAVDGTSTVETFDGSPSRAQCMARGVIDLLERRSPAPEEKRPDIGRSDAL